MIVTTPDKYFCDICNNEVMGRELMDYRLYRSEDAGKSYRTEVAEFHVCSTCEPSNVYFNCEKKKSLIKIIIGKFLYPKENKDSK